MSQRQKMNGYAMLAIVAWALSYPLTRMVNGQFSAASIGFFRCMVAAIILLLIGKKEKIQPMRKEHILLFALGGFVGFSGYLILFNTGMDSVLSSTASVIIATAPILTAIAAIKIYGEKINGIGWLSIGIAFFGVAVLLLWENGLSINKGAIWIGLAAILFSVYNLMNRELGLRGFSATEIVTYCMAFGAVELLPFAPSALQEAAASSLSDMLPVLGLAIFPSATAYLSWSKAMGYAQKTSDVTNFLFLTPLVTTIFGFFMMREVPNWGTVIGGVMIICALILFQKKGKVSEPAE